MPRTPFSQQFIFLSILCLEFVATTAQDTASSANNTLGARTGTTANTTLVLAPPQTSTVGTDTVAFEAPNAVAANESTVAPAPANNTAANSTQHAVQQQQQPEVPTAAASGPAISNEATSNAANGTASDDMIAVESASLPNEPITAEEALLMHAQLQDLLLSEGQNFSAASDLGSYQGIFDAHNQYKVRHQGSLYSWSSTLASNAAGYASRCIFAHDPNRNAGENIYATTSKDVAYALNQASASWYNEVSAYDFLTGAVRYGLSGSTMIGHFTQLVWLGSSMMGCAAAVCNYGITNFQPGTIIICRYAPAGNVIGQYVQNVRPATSTSSTPAPAPGPAPTSSSTSPNLATVVATPAQDLKGPGCKSSPDQRYWLCVWDTGEAIFYQGQTPRWRTNTSGGGKPFRLVVWGNGNMYLDNTYDQFVWQSGTARGTPPHRLLLQNDGRLVLYDANSYAIWSVS